MRIAALMLLVTGLVGCSMAESTLIADFNDETPGGIGCHSDAGTYYLSKTYFKVQVNAVGQGADADYTLKHLEPVIKADRRQGYCLDYLASPTAEEKVKVKLTTNYLLRWISTESLDQTGYILKKLIRSVFKSIKGASARSARTSKGRSYKAFEAEYDPFDPIQSAHINNALKDFGYCIVLEGRTLDLSRTTVEQYCNNPLGGYGHGKGATSYGLKTRPPKRRKGARGILYRPRVSHTVYLFLDEVPDDGVSDWKLAQVEKVLLENASPIITVGIDRSFFAARKATLLFDEGQLRNVCIHKTSELEEAVSVPLELVQGLAALPAEIVQFKIDNTNNYNELAQAENELIKTQQRHLKILRDEEAGDKTNPESRTIQETNQDVYKREAIAKTKFRDVADGANGGIDRAVICPPGDQTEPTVTFASPATNPTSAGIVFNANAQ